MTPEAPQRRLAAILSADVKGYSRLMADDDVATVQTLTTYREIMGSLVREHRGRVVDSPGDNLLAEFPSAVDATRCAVEIQRALGARNAGLPPDRRMEFRIGVHLGDIMVDGGRIYGDGVNIAARLEGLAEPGGITISGAVHDQVENKLDLGYEDLGAQVVKNIPRPVRAHRIRLDGSRRRTPAAPPTRSRLALGLAAAALIAGTVAAWHWVGARRQTPSAQVQADRIRSLAVLPFDNLSGDPEQAYFTDGMTDALITDLAKISALRVISRTSIMHYKDSHKPLPEIAHELNVDGVIEGTVLRAGGAVRITAQLIDARSDHHVWSESYERDLRDVLALQREVASAIARRIEARLTPDERARLSGGQPVQPDAYEAALKGWHFLQSRTPQTTRKSVEYFERAIAADPSYAPAYAGLAFAYT